MTFEKTPGSGSHNTSDKAKHGIPSTRLFKVLNPELYMKPNKWIMYGGLVAITGIVFWLGSGELKHRQEQAIMGSAEADTGSKMRELTYQEKMAELKRSPR
ncbi:hypothetical protein COEREDRAFT_87426 [Coemansia reversa NRRL 1564]|uniref:Uncharacterized protein n=1 Tax=Coemansia reversa (strain ATCC 12441 / NRRL 1564) TaxID=763665 RepID=A0A2G5BA91_COERN|nr:hypothetical protein COEREDRAFT_87426 [Coemansia reversa NRRL 1564]|eukprot:PIA15931.1 hypothetical protein COEREDRAFT_87426 [Coemansia reversa NRRL 1564]